MEAKECIFKRRSIRSYKPIFVSDEQIDDLLKAAMAAPSAKNAKPWSFYVIRNIDVLSKIKESIASTNYDARLAIVVAGDMSKALKDEARDYWIEDCAAATENILLSATYLGLGAVWCGLYPVKKRVDFLREILHLDHSIIPFAFINIGYPNENKEKRTQYDESCVHIVQ